MDIKEFEIKLKSEFPKDTIDIKEIEDEKMYTTFINGKENRFNYFTDRDLSNQGEYLLKWVVVELKFLKKFGICWDGDNKLETLMKIVE